MGTMLLVWKVYVQFYSSSIKVLSRKYRR